MVFLKASAFIRAARKGTVGVVVPERDQVQRLRGYRALQATLSEWHKAGQPRLDEATNKSLPPEDKGPTPPTIPQEFQEYQDVFDKTAADTLPNRRPFDHQIPLFEGTMPPHGPIYPLSPTELKTLREYLDEHLANGFIRPSQSPAAAPILFVKKKDGSLRLCVDYRGLNKITVKNRYPLPLITEMLNRLSTAKYFTKIDLRNAYNQIRIAKGDEWKTAFRTRYGLYEYLVMPFGLTNAPASFQHLVNSTFHDMIDRFVVAYLDDILIYSDTREEHEQHVRTVLKRLRDAGLYAKGEKCEFYSTTVEFLGYIVSPEGIQMDPEKVRAISEWPRPETLTQTRSFLGFANFYRHFIANYSHLVAPLTSLTKTTTKWQWNERAEESFKAIKEAFAKGGLLAHYDPTKPIIVETDASDFAIGAVLSQLHGDKLRPVAFFSRKLNPAEMNYEIHDKELLAIVSAFKVWRQYCEGASHKIKVVTDHQPLVYFETKRQLSRRQARWSEVLSNYDYKIEYRSGKQSTKPDALSRRPDYEPTTEDDAYNFKRLLAARTRSTTTTTPQPKSDHTRDKEVLASTHEQTFQPDVTTVIDEATSGNIPLLADQCDNDFLGELKAQQSVDPHLTTLVSNGLLTEEALTRGYSQDDAGIISQHGKLYLPEGQARLDVLREYHDQPLAGHLGPERTKELVSRHFIGKGLNAFIKEYVTTCQSCQRNKTRRHKPYGKLQPLPIPETPWKSISMDFIDQLPKSAGFDSILVVIDRRTKMGIFEPCKTNITAPELAKLFIRAVVSKHGLPDFVVSDRGNKFVSKFWKDLMKALHIKHSKSTAYHPQTDGQTERVNQALEEFLRHFSNYQQTNWADLLPIAEFAYNNGRHSTTTISPFYANYGFHPRFNTLETHNRDVRPHLDNLYSTYETLTHRIREAQLRQKLYHDRRRMDPPDFGDEVYLSTAALKTKRKTKKLDHKYVGPFKVFQRKGPNHYQLELPHSLRIHNVFNVSRLEPAKSNTIPHRHQTPPPPIHVESDAEEYEVAEVLDSKLDHGKLYYLVKWEGYENPNDNTWEPPAHLKNSEELVRKFHNEYPDRPGP